MSLCCLSQEWFPSVDIIYASVYFSDAHFVVSINKHHSILQPLCSVSYMIVSQPPGTKLIPISIFMNSSGRWFPLVSRPVILMVPTDVASIIIPVYSVSIAPSRSNQCFPIWSSHHTMCHDLIPEIFLLIHGFMVCLVDVGVVVWFTTRWRARERDQTSGFCPPNFRR